MPRLFFALVLLAACGTRTGLEVDTESVVPGGDGSVDAAPRDSGLDADAGVDGAVPIGVTGTWIAIGDDGTVGGAFQLHQRADGRVLGTILGGTTGRLILAARLRGDTLELTYLMRNPQREAESSSEGTVDGDQIRFVRMAGGETRTTIWHRVTDSLVELRWLLSGTELPFEVELDATLRERELVSGAVVSHESCSPFPCSGDLTAYRDDVGSASRSVEIEGRSSGQIFSVSASGPPGGPLAGVGRLVFEDGRDESHALTATLVATTRSEDAGQLLSALGTVADAREGGIGGGERLPISDAYRHDGVLREGLLGAFRAERESFATLTVDVSEIRQMQTREPSGEPSSSPSVGLHFRERAVGFSDAGDERLLHDADTTEPGGDRMRYFHWEDAATLLVFGNQR